MLLSYVASYNSINSTTLHNFCTYFWR